MVKLTRETGVVTGVKFEARRAAEGGIAVAILPLMSFTREEVWLRYVVETELASGDRALIAFLSVLESARRTTVEFAVRTTPLVRV